jgi:hypothetical protein
MAQLLSCEAGRHAADRNSLVPTVRREVIITSTRTQINTAHLLNVPLPFLHQTSIQRCSENLAESISEFTFAEMMPQISLPRTEQVAQQLVIFSSHHEKKPVQRL